MRVGVVILLFLLSGIFCCAQKTDVPPPIFTKKGGIYSKPQRFKLKSSIPDAEIYFSVDASTPDKKSRKYNKGLIVKKTATIKARTLSDGQWSEITTQTFIINRDYTLPIVSISTEPDNLWDRKKGIYVRGLGKDSVYPYDDANFWEDWEVPINFEFFDTDGLQKVNQIAGMKIFGGWSRPMPQKSVAIYGRKKYGNKYFRYNFFKERPFEKYKTFILRNSGSDFNNSQFRDVFITSLVSKLDLERQAAQPVIVLLNGKYWGIQNLREKIDQYYLNNHFNVHVDSVDLIKHQMSVKEGDANHYKSMIRHMENNSLSVQEHYDYIANKMEIANYTDYNITETFIDNQDAGGNIRFWRPRTPNGKWRWILFDTDFGFGLSSSKAYKNNTLKMFTQEDGPKWPNPPWSTLIIRKLLENDTYKTFYINRFADLLNTTFFPETVVHALDSFYTIYDKEIDDHLQKWKRSRRNWERNLSVMKEFAQKRPDYMREHLMEKFDLKSVKNLRVNVSNPEMGYVKVNSIIPDYFPWTGKYFEGNPVTVTAKPVSLDYKFIKWEGYNSENDSFVVDLKENLQVQAVFSRKQKSKYFKQIIFNEICYGDSSTKSGDWVEIYNNSDKSLNLSGWVFSDSKIDHVYHIPKGTKLAANDYIILCQNKDAFLKQYPKLRIKSVGSFGFGLSSKGEKLRLLNKADHFIDSITYYPHIQPRDSVKYAVIALKNPEFNNHNPNNWIGQKIATPGHFNEWYANFFEEFYNSDKWKRVRMFTIYILSFLTLVLIPLMIIIIVKSKKDSKTALNKA